MNRIPFIHIFVILAFLLSILGISPVEAQEFVLPKPGVMVNLSPEFNPPMLKGIKVYQDNPLRFDFILDKGDGNQNEYQIKKESSKLVKYFLASLTIPEKDLWVNLSPYEKDRIIPENFGLTEMGRDLLAEDYMLKQITASLIYPEGSIGKMFWKRVYEEVKRRYQTTDIPVNTFNKVWIVPEKAVVYENAKAGTAYVVESQLKVMLEEDYLALQKHTNRSPLSLRNDTHSIGAKIIREIVIPELSKEVNENRNFAQLRQVYNSLILATWYKKKIKDSILGQIYANKNKTAGVQYTSTVIPAQAGVHFKNDVEGVYREYLKAFKKGVYSFIKEEPDVITQEIVPRKYFSGGVKYDGIRSKLDIGESPAMLARISDLKDKGIKIAVNIVKILSNTPFLLKTRNEFKGINWQERVKVLAIREQQQKSKTYLRSQEGVPSFVKQTENDLRRLIVSNGFKELSSPDRKAVLEILLKEESGRVEPIINLQAGLILLLNSNNFKRLSADQKQRVFRIIKNSSPVYEGSIANTMHSLIESEGFRALAEEDGTIVLDIIEQMIGWSNFTGEANSFIKALIDFLNGKFLTNYQVQHPDTSIFAFANQISYLGKYMISRPGLSLSNRLDVLLSDTLTVIFPTVGNNLQALLNLSALSRSEKNRLMSATKELEIIPQGDKDVRGFEEQANPFMMEIRKIRDNPFEIPGMIRFKSGREITREGWKMIYEHIRHIELYTWGNQGFPKIEGSETGLKLPDMTTAQSARRSVEDLYIRYQESYNAIIRFYQAFRVNKVGWNRVESTETEEDLENAAIDDTPGYHVYIHFAKSASEKYRFAQRRFVMAKGLDIDDILQSVGIHDSRGLLIQEPLYPQGSGSIPFSDELTDRKIIEVSLAGKSAAMISFKHAASAGKDGGIDFTSNKTFQTQNAGEIIKFHVDYAELAQFQNTTGFKVGSITIQPLKSISEFLGFDRSQASIKIAAPT